MSRSTYPRLFGKYALLRPLAKGGMGQLYLAAAGDVGGYEKLCVVKKLLPGKGGHYSRRFLDEAKVVVRLSHANLVSVFDVGQVGGDFYIAMEYVEGKNLRQIWNECARLKRRIPVDVALFIAREICRGLAYAHEYGHLGLVHRDVSPPNVLLSYFGEIKLTDFGLAQSILKQEQTAPGIVFGRYSYLSPEQARGRDVDARTDLYSLGIILWELLTGKQLFPPQPNDPAKAIRQLRSPSIVAPSHWAANVPPELDAVALRAVAPDRELRFQTAEEMRRALTSVLVRLSPTLDSERIRSFLSQLYGDAIEHERRECERLLEEELPRIKQASSQPRAVVDVSSVARSDPHDLVGRVFSGRYQLTGLLGIGAMGAVYEGEHVEIGKRVAIKVLHPRFSRQAELVARFRREARAASMIGHANIVDVMDFGTTDEGLFYLVMERLAGVELGDLLEKETKLDPDRAVRITIQLCRALSAAHAQGMIHRDLKPENVMLVQRDENPEFVKILDFGVAKALRGDMTALTEPGITMGTPEYMAPEQAVGQPVDARSDIYSVGAMLYEMLCGAAPHEADDPMSVLAKKLNRDPLPVSALRPEVSSALERIVMRAISRDPALRPQTMDEFANELASAMIEAQSVDRVLEELALEFAPKMRVKRRRSP